MAQHFLHSAAALPLAFGAARAAQPAPADVVSFPGLIEREHEPANLEFPFSSLDRFVVPTERFYVRSHFATPKIDPRFEITYLYRGNVYESAGDRVAAAREYQRAVALNPTNQAARDALVRVSR